MVRLRITNTYADRESTVEVCVPDPDSLDPADLVDWWEGPVFAETGDGLGGYADYEAVVLESDKYPSLVGEEYGWQG